MNYLPFLLAVRTLLLFLNVQLTNHWEFILHDIDLPPFSFLPFFESAWYYNASFLIDFSIFIDIVFFPAKELFFDAKKAFTDLYWLMSYQFWHRWLNSLRTKAISCAHHDERYCVTSVKEVVISIYEREWLFLMRTTVTYNSTYWGTVP